MSLVRLLIVSALYALFSADAMNNNLRNDKELEEALENLEERRREVEALMRDPGLTERAIDKVERHNDPESIKSTTSATPLDAYLNGPDMSHMAMAKALAKNKVGSPKGRVLQLQKAGLLRDVHPPALPAVVEGKTLRLQKPRPLRDVHLPALPIIVEEPEHYTDAKLVTPHPPKKPRPSTTNGRRFITKQYQANHQARLVGKADFLF